MQNQQAAKVLWLGKIKLSEIAAILNVTQRTVERWKSDGDWDSLLDNQLKNLGSLEADLLAISAKTAAAIRESKEANPSTLDGLCKVISSLAKLRGKQSLQDTVLIMKDYQTFLQSYDAELAQQNIDAMTKYIQTKAI